MACASGRGEGRAHCGGLRTVGACDRLRASLDAVGEAEREATFPDKTVMK